MRIYNVVTNYNVIKDIKTSKYFKVNLGMAITMEKNGERLLSDKDHFAASYNYQYKTSIYGQGNIGGIKFYIDHFIHEDILAVYFNLEEFIFNYDKKLAIEKGGIDAYLGYLLKSTDDMYEERMERNKQEAIEKDKKAGVAEMLTKNPGAVTYDDVKKYIQEKKFK
jgi:hypothetical protein